MRPNRLINPALALVMALGLIGVGGSVPLVGSDSVATAATCLSLNTLDARYGIQINVDTGPANNGVLYNGSGQRAGAVISPTRDQVRSLRSMGWVVQGESRIRSAWAPARCGQLATGGWTPSVTVARTCMSVAQLDQRFGIVEDASGTRNGLIRHNRKIIGAVVYTTQSQRTSLRQKDWVIQGASSTVKSIFSPLWCRPLKLGGWSPSSRCYTFSELSNQYGIVSDAPNGGRVYADGKLAGAILHLDSSERSKLTSEWWTIQDGDTSDDVATAWSPTRCRPLSES